MHQVLRAGVQLKHGKNLREGINGQPQPQHLCGAAQPGAQFVQLEVVDEEEYFPPKSIDDGTQLPKRRMIEERNHPAENSRFLNGWAMKPAQHHVTDCLSSLWAQVNLLSIGQAKHLP